VNRLIRTAYGPFQLGKLAKDAIEEIPTKQLREQLGRKICEEIGL
jgi:23S rRNA pseudouridine2605 synthase